MITWAVTPLLIGHGDTVISIAWSPNGEILATGSDDYTLRLWNSATGTLLHTEQDRWPDSLVWTSNYGPQTGGNNLLLCAGYGEDITRINIYAWDIEWTPGDVDNSLIVRAHNSAFIGQASSRGGDIVDIVCHGDTMVSLTNGMESTIKTWNLNSIGTDAVQTTEWIEWDTPGSSGSYVRAISLTHVDGDDLLAVGMEDCRVMWHNLRTREVHAFDYDFDEHIGHTDDVKCVAWSPGGDLLASGGFDHSIILWTRSTGGVLHILTGHSSVVGCVAWSSSGDMLASCSPGHVKTWNTDTGTLLRTILGYACVAWSPLGGVLASVSADGDVKLWTCCMVCGVPAEVDDHPRGGRCGVCMDKLQEREAYIRMLHGGRDSRILPAEMMRMIANRVVGLPPSTTQFCFSLLCV